MEMQQILEMVANLNAKMDDKKEWKSIEKRGRPTKVRYSVLPFLGDESSLLTSYLKTKPHRSFLPNPQSPTHLSNRLLTLIFFTLIHCLVPSQ
jgi:hypothetical protein